LATAEVLRSIEKATGRKIRELFDMIGGTSIGGCVALTVSSGTSIDRLVDLLEGLAYKGTDGKGTDAVMAYCRSYRGSLRLLSHGCKVPEEIIVRYDTHCIASLGYDALQKPPRPGEAEGWPHTFCVSSLNAKKGNAWVPYVSSNYPRSAASLKLNLELGGRRSVESQTPLEAAIAEGSDGWVEEGSLRSTASESRKTEYASAFVHVGSVNCTLLGMLRATTAAPTYFPPYNDKDGREHAPRSMCEADDSRTASLRWHGGRQRRGAVVVVAISGMSMAA